MAKGSGIFIDVPDAVHIDGNVIESEGGAATAAPERPQFVAEGDKLDAVLDMLRGMAEKQSDLAARLDRVEQRTPSTRPMQGPQKAYVPVTKGKAGGDVTLPDLPYIPHGSRGKQFTRNTVRRFRRAFADGQAVRINPDATRPGGMGRAEYHDARPKVARGEPKPVLIKTEGGEKQWRTVKPVTWGEVLAELPAVECQQGPPDQPCGGTITPGGPCDTCGYGPYVKEAQYLGKDGDWKYLVIVPGVTSGRRGDGFRESELVPA